MIVTVIGAGGHVGLPFSLVCAKAGHTVYGVDTNKGIVDQLNKGIVPYIEHGAKELLDRQLSVGNLCFTTDPSCIKDSDVVAIMLGTPVDHENNPRLDDLFTFINSTLCPSIQKGTLVVLRSTVAPGTTELVRDRIEKKKNWKEGEDFFLVFCPERVLQTKGIEETQNLPALIGAFNDKSFVKATLFCHSFTKEYLYLSPREAEIAKLMTNMYRYVNFAFANEMWMIGEKQGVDINKVIQAANYGYKRMDVPLPGPNVGGPCLFKDGRFLLSDVPFIDLIQTAFIINEGMPDYIYNSIRKIQPKLNKVLILGATFKADCDDTRNSLSFKMKKVCKKHGVKVYIEDPYYEEEIPTWTHMVYDAVILMTPHSEYKDWITKHNLRNDCVIADVWKHFPESEKQTTGIYKVGDIK